MDDRPAPNQPPTIASDPNQPAPPPPPPTPPPLPDLPDVPDPLVSQPQNVVSVEPAESPGSPQPPPPPPPPPPLSGEVPIGEPLPAQPPSAGRPIARLILPGLVVLLIGGLVVGGALFLQRKGAQEVPTQKAEEISPTPPPAPLTLTLESPQDGQVVTEANIAILAKTTPRTTVIFFTEESEGSLESGGQGEASATAVLALGLNEIVVAALASDGESKQKVRHVLYDREKHEGVIFGEVTRIANGIFTIKPKQGATVDIATSSATEVLGAKKKRHTPSAITVGDVLAVVATESGVASPSAKKVASKLFLKEGERKLFSGVVTGINDSVVTMLERGEQEAFFNLKVATDTAIVAKGGGSATVGSLTLEQHIAAVGSTDEEGNVLVKLIRIVSDK